MAYSVKHFFLDEGDAIYRVATTTFTQMVHGPKRVCFRKFSGARIRMAEVIVELQQRRPIRVVRLTFDMLTFDLDGYLDATTYLQHQYARAELALEPVLGKASSIGNVVKAQSRFIDHGGRWAPSMDMAKSLERAALGLWKCKLLK
jgi:hypothetical protein